jgi:membrane-associated PAP2 superfamily phosphatase
VNGIDAVPATTERQTTQRRQDLLVALSLAALAAFVQGSPIDLWLADRLIHWECGAWTLRHSWLLDDMMHDGVNQLVKGLQIGIVLATALAFAVSRFARWRRPLLYLTLAMPLSAGLVALLKAWTNMDCPYDLVGFGGDRPFVGLFEIRPDALPRGRCFPAGHASGAYGYLGLYFLGRRHGLAWPGLAIPLAAGLILGVTQQLRGAHFLTHDLWTLALCWLVCWTLSELVLQPPGRVGSMASIT